MANQNDLTAVRADGGPDNSAGAARQGQPVRRRAVSTPKADETEPVVTKAAEKNAVEVATHFEALPTPAAEDKPETVPQKESEKATPPVPTLPRFLHHESGQGKQVDTPEEYWAAITQGYYVAGTR